MNKKEFHEYCKKQPQCYSKSQIGNYKPQQTATFKQRVRAMELQHAKGREDEKVFSINFKYHGSLEELLEMFENGKERYENEIGFSYIIDFIMKGANILYLLEDIKHNSYKVLTQAQKHIIINRSYGV